MDAPRTVRVTLLLASLGAVCGALAAIAITAFGKLITGAPPATVSNYLWNVGAFAIIAAIGSPFLTWSALRRVPVWRAITEPALGALAGGAVALAFGMPIAFLLLMPVGIGVAAWRLQHVFRERIALMPPSLPAAERDARALREPVSADTRQRAVDGRGAV